MPQSNAINNYTFNFPVGPTLPGMTYPQAYVAGNSGGSGNQDIYTCPTGKRALCYGISMFNTTVGNINVFSEIYVSGTYYQLEGLSVLSGSANTSAFTVFPIVLEAGERLALNTNATGATLFGNVVEFDNTAILKTYKVLSLSAGDNTIYTVPAGKSAIVLDAYCALNINVGTKAFGYFNGSGGSRTLNAFIVQSGGSTGTTNKIINSTVVTNGAVLSNNFTFCSMQAGDFFVVNTDAGTATQTCWINVLEV